MTVSCSVLASCNTRRPNSCPIPILLLRLDTPATTTGYNRSPMLSPRFDLPGFRSGTETKREVWLLRTWFGIGPVNKLVSLTWLLCALRSFRRFTLHYKHWWLKLLGRNFATISWPKTIQLLLTLSLFLSIELLFRGRWGKKGLWGNKNFSICR